KKAADTVKASMMAGSFVIFKGPIKDNKGGVAIAAGTSHPQTDWSGRACGKTLSARQSRFHGS
ncbi:hypothetical protein ACRXB1_15790, partial [Caballeronia sp. M23-90]